MVDGENTLIDWLRERFAAEPHRAVIGIGDDAAAVRTDDTLIVITTDMLLDGVHFDTGRHRFEQIGRKAVCCSLSDCAAMACWPRAATVSIALPENMSLDDVKRMADGMAETADEFHCPIVGGDTTSWPGKLAIDVAMLAEPMAERGPVRRSNAQVDDLVFVSGPLGGSRSGKHLTFTPRIELASRLVLDPNLHAMMDISDGLSLDLHRLCTASACDAELTADRLDNLISDAARDLAAKDGRSPLEHALGDGEDFELLLTASGELNPEDVGLIPIGRITSRTSPDRSTLWMCHDNGRTEPIEPRGYEHL